MSHKVSIYLDDEHHRELKAAASRLGLSLSEFMARAAMNALKQPNRWQAAAAMDEIRRQSVGTLTDKEIREMREYGRE